MTTFNYSLTACPECDLLLNEYNTEQGDKAHCPRCYCLLQRTNSRSIEQCFALSIAGLLLMIPANTLPLVSIKILANSHTGILWTGVMALFKEGYWAVAILVGLSSILFPFIHTLLALLISAHLYFNKPHRYLALYLRWLHHLSEWAMLEVYMLGIIVACVKLCSMAELTFGFGLYAFIALLIISVLLSNQMDNHLFWRKIAQLNHESFNG